MAGLVPAIYAVRLPGTMSDWPAWVGEALTFLRSA